MEVYPGLFGMGDWLGMPVQDRLVWAALAEQTRRERLAEMALAVRVGFGGDEKQFRAFCVGLTGEPEPTKEAKVRADGVKNQQAYAQLKTLSWAHRQGKG